MRIAGSRRAALRPIAAMALLALASCQREAPPVYVPPPPGEPAAPAVPTGERLTIARACATDIEQFCAGVPPRQGFIKKRMRSYVTELSAGCFDAVMSAVAAEQAP